MKKWRATDNSKFYYFFSDMYFSVILFFSAQETLDKFVRSEALAKKELASFRSKMFKDEHEAMKMFGK